MTTAWPDPLLHSNAYAKKFAFEFKTRDGLPQGFDAIALGAIAEAGDRSPGTESLRSSFALQCAGETLLPFLLHRAWDRVLTSTDAGDYGLVRPFGGYVHEFSPSKIPELFDFKNGKVVQPMEPYESGLFVPSPKPHPKRLGRLERALHQTMCVRMWQVGREISQKPGGREILQAFVLAKREQEFNPEYAAQSLTAQQIASMSNEQLSAQVASVDPNGVRYLVRLAFAIPRLKPETPSHTRTALEQVALAFNSFLIIGRSTGWKNCEVGFKDLDGILPNTGPPQMVVASANNGSSRAVPSPGVATNTIYIWGKGRKPEFEGTPRQLSEQTASPKKVHHGCPANRPGSDTSDRKNTWLLRVYVHCARMLAAEGHYGDLSKVPNAERKLLEGPLVGADGLAREGVFISHVRAMSNSTSATVDNSVTI